ncbi:hypothetical protein BSKO_11764 [Bryopsis sp. KO-2023]|nr:hypothetical protein BSKO_11762 [Bryopsis sp. KO-2023]GMH43830.1 hypothetical protein BSKO_11764 [Bryopsis sp. KO-2023]
MEAKVCHEILIENPERSLDFRIKIGCIFNDPEETAKEWKRSRIITRCRAPPSTSDFFESDVHGDLSGSGRLSIGWKVPIVLPIFTKKYALNISIAYEIPGDEDPSADVSAATSAQIRGRSLLQSREPTHGAYFSINLEKKDGKEVLDFGDNVKLVGYQGLDGNEGKIAFT